MSHPFVNINPNICFYHFSCLIRYLPFLQNVYIIAYLLMGMECTNSVALFMHIFQFNDFQLTSIKRILEETIMWAYMLWWTSANVIIISHTKTKLNRMPINNDSIRTAWIIKKIYSYAMMCPWILCLNSTINCRRMYLQNILCCNEYGHLFSSLSFVCVIVHVSVTSADKTVQRWPHE